MGDALMSVHIRMRLVARSKLAVDTANMKLELGKCSVGGKVKGSLSLMTFLYMEATRGRWVKLTVR
jgi:hypothetical protein